jgi:UDP-N-acetylglucosamine 4,6-dehydratase
VVGSKGSVIPLFLSKREGRVIPITDRRMTRFWITLEQGVYFVLRCLENMVGGEIFVPKIPSMKVLDLAKLICPDCRIQVIGMRPGEKLHEVLIPKDEARNAVELDDYFIIKPSFRFFERRFCADGCQGVPEDFEYRSDENTWWLSAESMLNIIDNYIVSVNKELDIFDNY